MTLGGSLILFKYPVRRWAEVFCKDWLQRVYRQRVLEYHQGERISHLASRISHFAISQVGKGVYDCGHRIALRLVLLLFAYPAALEATEAPDLPSWANDRCAGHWLRGLG